MPEAPEFRLRHGQGLLVQRLAARRHAHGRGGGSGHGSAGPVAVRIQFIEARRHLRRHRGGQRALEHNLHVHVRRVRGDLRRRDVGAPVGDVHRRRLDEPDVPVDAAARVPPGGQRRIVEADGEDVVLPGLEVGRQVELEGGVAVGPAADELPVEPDHRVRHRAVDLEVDTPAVVLRGRGDVLPVPAHAPPGQPGGGAVVFLVERALDAPVVRQAECAPGAVGEAWLDVGNVAAEVAGGARRLRGRGVEELVAGGLEPVLGGGVGQPALDLSGIPLGEAPVGVERDPLARGRAGRLRRGDGPQASRQEKEEPGRRHFSWTSQTLERRAWPPGPSTSRTTTRLPGSLYW